MDAEIIAVGSELLTPSRIDTNSLWLTGQLNALGVELSSKSVIGDDRAGLSGAVSLALERSGIIILTGGLGPTEDDVTRDAVAAALGRDLVFDQRICDVIDGRFRAMGRKMAENNKRQAYVIEGAEVLDNENGTAPGLWITADSGAVIILMPGPPRELKPLFEKECLKRLVKLVPRLAIRTRQYRVAGMAESDLDQLIAPVYQQYDSVETTVLASPGDIQIHLRARCETGSEAEEILAEVGPKIETLLGDRIYSHNGDTLEATVGGLLKKAGATVAVAESCTGGMLAGTITSVPGSSDYFAGGFLVYSAEQKTRLLGVPKELIEEHSVVSREVAEAMALAAAKKTGATHGISVTGEAGPDPATDNPPGTVFIGLAQGGRATAERFRFLGDRDRVRMRAVRHSLDMLRKSLSQ